MLIMHNPVGFFCRANCRVGQEHHSPQLAEAISVAGRAAQPHVHTACRQRRPISVIEARASGLIQIKLPRYTNTRSTAPAATESIDQSAFPVPRPSTISNLAAYANARRGLAASAIPRRVGARPCGRPRVPLPVAVWSCGLRCATLLQPHVPSRSLQYIWSMASHGARARKH